MNALMCRSPRHSWLRRQVQGGHSRTPSGINQSQVLYNGQTITPCSPARFDGPSQTRLDWRGRSRQRRTLSDPSKKFPTAWRRASPVWQVADRIEVDSSAQPLQPPPLFTLVVIRVVACTPWRPRRLLPRIDNAQGGVAYLGLRLSPHCRGHLHFHGRMEEGISLIPWT